MFRTLLTRHIPICRLRYMSSSAGTMTSPFSQAVVNSMRKLYPEALSDKSFDNTGLLLEAPFDPSRCRANSVLLTIDLTKAVADEAIENNHSVIVAYHPIIFRGLKSLTLGDSQQRTLLRLATEGISVYSPHTAVDAVPGGMADWLCDIVTGQLDAPEPETHTGVFGTNGTSISEGAEDTSDTATKLDSSPDTIQSDDPFVSPKPKDGEASNSTATPKTYSKPTYPTSTTESLGDLHLSKIQHTRRVVNPSPDASISTANTATNSSPYTPENTGSGRLITFTTPQHLSRLIERIARGVGSPKGFPVAIPQLTAVESHIAIRTVAVCPGSGGSVLAHTRADLIFTGELSHHEALAVTERGGCVVSLFHSNSERGYLWSVMRGRLEEMLREEWKSVSGGIVEELGEMGRLGESLEAVLNDDTVRVDVSERDRDPYGIVVLGESEAEGVGL